MVSVAIPVLNGGERLAEVLQAVRSQRTEHEVEIVVCDSGSTDGSVGVARAAGAEVFSITPAEFSHGGTRNRLMARTQGAHVLFLTQDAVPAEADWLERLMEPFATVADLGLSFGPYRPRPDASPMVARELTQWFGSFGGGVRIDRLAPAEREVAARALHGHRGFFTDANGCVARAAWEEVPFRQVTYAEDHVLAHDMLRAGYAKAFVPSAAVVHSHDYAGIGWLRRSFDEARAVRATYDIDDAGRPLVALRRWRGGVAGDLRAARAAGGGAAAARLAPASGWHHALRVSGAALGAHAGRLPAGARARLSAERRA